MIENATSDYFTCFTLNFSKKQGCKIFSLRYKINYCTINQSKIWQQIKIPLPPIELQNKFAEVVKKIEALKVEKLKSAEKLENLFQSLQQKAFKGELFDDKVSER